MDDFDAYLTPQRQTKKIRSIFGSVERGLNTMKQILTPKRLSMNKPRKTWVESLLDSSGIFSMEIFLGNSQCHISQSR